MTIGGAIVNMIMKSENAKLMTNAFDGVRRDFVFMKMYMTQRFPSNATTPNTKMAKPRIDC